MNKHLSHQISQASDYYTSGDWFVKHKDTDSSHKVLLVDSLLKKSQISWNSSIKAAEIGCSQGAFLLPLANYLTNHKVEYKLFGYDISLPAINLAKSRNKYSESNVSFSHGSSEDIPSELDFIFCMDVLEHVENPWQILRELSGKSKYVILHLPIESSIGHLLTKSPSRSYKTFQHIHFFSWETAQIMIKESPFEILDYQFTGAVDISFKTPGNMMLKTLRLLRYFAYRLNPQFAALLGGGSVLLLLQNRQINTVQN